jgi:lipopolysaccharide biosynthesis regulator YciM
MSMRAVRPLICAVFVLFAQTTIASAQQSDAAELLKEVRLLRQTIETISATSMRVQIVFGRLQLQEQRTVSATQRLETARKRLDEIVEQIAESDAVLKQYLEAGEISRDPEHREILARIRRESDLQRVRMEAQRARAAAEEADAANCLALEQGQWSDLSQRLEDLERSLARRQ